MKRTVAGFVFLAGASAYASVAACGSSDFGSPDVNVDGGSTVNGVNCDVTLTPAENACVVDETLAVFVSSTTGDGAPDGTRVHPYPTFQSGIAAAKKAQKKRVYACTGDYQEQVTLVDGVSLFGDLDCKQNWTVVSAHANVVSPASPAVRGDQIQSATRIDSIDFAAPAGSAATPSSIAMILTSSPGLTIANATILAGNGLNGSNGSPGIELVQTGSLTGTSNAMGSRCTAGSMVVAEDCPQNAAAGAVSICSYPDGGLADDGGWNGGQGGIGGTGGGCFTGGLCGSAPPTPCCTSVAYNPGPGTSPPGGNAGQSGANGNVGTNGGSGTISSAGYQPANGASGQNGGPGAGGAGGMGNPIPTLEGVAPSGQAGSAGGCPGLAGTAGTGGGASIAVITIDSGITFDTCTLQASNGGNAGKGMFGSEPTAGGPGAGSGGQAGWSGNGSAGPSYGVASHGVAPTLKNTKTLLGRGGAGVALATSGSETIPASPEGISQNTVTF